MAPFRSDEAHTPEKMWNTTRILETLIGAAVTVLITTSTTVAVISERLDGKVQLLNNQIRNNQQNIHDRDVAIDARLVEIGARMDKFYDDFYRPKNGQ